MPATLTVLRHGWTGAPVELPVDLTLEHLLAALRSAAAQRGDVALVTGSRAADADELVRLLATPDEVHRRTDDITDVFEGAAGSRLLAAAGVVAECHHLQVRRLPDLSGSACAQVAAYPEPLRCSGRRVWADPPLVVVFVPAGADVSVLPALQVMWERLRVQHAPPLRSAEDPALKARYRRHDTSVPMADAEWTALEAAVGQIVTSHDLLSVLDPDSPVGPAQQIESVLTARAVLTGYARRLEAVDNCGGPRSTKLSMLQERAAQLVPDEDTRTHLVAPHRHVADQLQETIGSIAALVEEGAATAGLVSTTALARLLDRSEANRATATLVTFVLTVLAVLTAWTSLASVPGDGRLVEDLGGLGAWVGIGLSLSVLIGWGLGGLARRPPSASPAWLRVHRSRFVVTGIGVMALGLLICGLTGSLLALAVGLAGTLVAGVVVAATARF